jgi:hypothetical protein
MLSSSKFDAMAIHALDSQKKTSSPKPLSQDELADHVAIFFRETSHDS